MHATYFHLSPGPSAQTLLTRPWSGEKNHHRPLPLHRRWSPLRKRHICSAYKILRAVRKGQFSAPAKLTTGLTTPSQSLAPLEILKAGPPLLRKLCLGCDETLHKLWWSFCMRFTSGHGRWRIDPLRLWTLVWRWYGGVGAGPEFGYKYGEKWTRSTYEIELPLSTDRLCSKLQ